MNRRAFLMTSLAAAPALCLKARGAAAPQAQIQRVWLSHREGTPERLTISCQTAAPAAVAVKAGREGAEATARDEGGTLHHLDVPFVDDGSPFRYELTVEGQPPVRGVLRPSPKDVWRVAVVGDWGYAPAANLAALRRDQSHLLVTVGDNVPCQHTLNGVGVKDGTRAYAALIDSQPELFRSTPFLPVLGNHDHEIRPRGAKPSAEPVYDVEATAFRSFFALPAPGWHWRFDHPRFGARLLALDLHHTSDFGTTWQTGHDFGPESEQLRWFDAQTAAGGARHVVALQNERNATMRSLKGWGPLFARCSAVLTGFGYFAERAEPAGGVPFFNTSLGGRGAKYADSASKFLAGEDSYLLLSFKERGPMKVELKSLDGRVLDTTEWPSRKETP